MTQNGNRLVRLGLAAAGTLTVVAVLVFWSMRTTHAQDNGTRHTPVHMTTDWSTGHVVYSAPSSMVQAWRLQAEPRYLHQWMRRNAAASQARNAR